MKREAFYITLVLVRNSNEFQMLNCKQQITRENTVNSHEVRPVAGKWMKITIFPRAMRMCTRTHLRLGWNEFSSRNKCFSIKPVRGMWNVSILFVVQNISVVQFLPKLLCNDAHCWCEQFFVCCVSAPQIQINEKKQRLYTHARTHRLI